MLRTLDPCRALGATLTFALTLGACGTTHSATRGAEDSMTQRRKQQVVALLNSIQTGDAAAKSKMTFKLKEGGEDMAAYLATLK